MKPGSMAPSSNRRVGIPSRPRWPSMQCVHGRGRLAIMGSLPLDKPDDSRARLSAWRSQAGMLGLRWPFLHEPPRQWLANATLDWLWAAAEAAQVPVAMLCTDSLADVGRTAERHPGLRLTVDHLSAAAAATRRTGALPP